MEALAVRLGLPSPDLTLAQRGLKVSRLTATSGAAVGVVVGCLLGMGTLLFMDTTSAEREKKQVSRLSYSEGGSCTPRLNIFCLLICFAVRSRRVFLITSVSAAGSDSRLELA